MITEDLCIYVVWDALNLSTTVQSLGYAQAPSRTFQGLATDHLIFRILYCAMLVSSAQFRIAWLPE